MEKEPIDKFEILEMSKVCADQGDLFAKNIRKTEELNAPEKLMLMSFTNVEMLYRSKLLPAKQKNTIIKSINAECQRFAIDIQRNKEYFERQIEAIARTEELRTVLAKQLNSGDSDGALDTAVELVDLYCFGIAEGTYHKALERAKSDKPEEKQYA